MYPGNGGQCKLKALRSVHSGYGFEEESQGCWKCANYVFWARSESHYGGHSQKKFVGIAEIGQNKDVAKGARDGGDRETEEAAS